MREWRTFGEIHLQPLLWTQWASELEPRLLSLHAWLRAQDHDAVWFCGSGTSAFIGESLASYLNARSDVARYRAVSCTDLVLQPRHLLKGDKGLLVVSFGRSGNSSESLGTLNALDALAPQADRLHISCNAAGALATRPAPGPGSLHRLVLPKLTNDSGFAMTSSYTTMLLTALACFDTPARAPLVQRMQSLADAATTCLQTLAVLGESAAHACPQRTVFLGSGPLLGVARESALKVLELTAGQVATLWDTPLGFRHGPKAFVDQHTRVYLLISDDPYTRRYEMDLAQEIRRQFGPQALFTVGPANAGCDFNVPGTSSDSWSWVLSVLPAQYLAMRWSHAMDLNVDNPFAGDGHLTRVVSGVTLYPVGDAR